MFELVLLFVVVPLRVFFAARAHGRSGFAWSLMAMGVFVVVELAIILACQSVYLLMSFLFGWEEDFDELVFTRFLYLFAMGCAMASAEVIRFRLNNPDVPYFDQPPPPERFHSP